MDSISHIVVDWGSSSFRLWALDRAGRVLGERRSAQGLAALAAKGFESVLEAHIAALGVGPNIPVMMCGMVGSRAGWVEVAYLDTPVALDGLAALGAPVPSRNRPIRILPGVAQRDPVHPDVMRGEETQLLALVAAGHDGLVCLPGTHSKWAVLKNRTLERFATFMTGELFHLLRSGSLVFPAVEGAGPVDPASPAFAQGVMDALSAPTSISNTAFALRAGWLLHDRPADATLARLSGLLIGTEIAGARGRMGDLDGITLVASEPAAALYGAALVTAGVTGVRVLDAEDCVRQGLHTAACAAFPMEGLTA